MKRREFLKASGLLCLSVQLPSVLAAQEVGKSLESRLMWYWDDGTNAQPRELMPHRDGTIEIVMEKHG